MLEALLQLGLFTAKAIILATLILLLIAGILALLSKGNLKLAGKIQIKNLNKKYQEIRQTLLEEILPKKEFKKYLKEQDQMEKKQKNLDKKNIYVLYFYGDAKGSTVPSLSKEITAVLSVAKPKDEVVICIESGGGMAHAYGLAAAQLTRIRQQEIPLTVIVDKVAASGGYLMASVANKILAAPFAIIGSIGVIVQLPNFHRLLQDKHIDFEQITAGNYKRTLTLFGHNTKEGREKLQQEVENIHQIFKNSIQQYRRHLDIAKVSTGEHWVGIQALELNLVDELKTSDDYLLACSKEANVFKITYQAKKSFVEKLFSNLGLYMKRNTLLEDSPIVPM
jgi:serine protease SohB